MKMTTAVQTQTKQRPWWLTLLTGISALILGAFFLWGAAGPAEKADVYIFLVTFLGIWWLVQGIFDIIAIFIDHSMWGWKLFMGIIGILAGYYILAYPIASAVALPRILVLVLGIWGLMYGVMLLIMAFQGAGWGAGILGGLGILFGLALIGDYGKLFSGISMLWAMAVMGVIGGIALIVQAFMQRKTAQ
jgi:uncharacterized membrane protein HdeD (DUF308 family)